MPTNCSSACCAAGRPRTTSLLCSVDGGGLRNAIPREATATVLVRSKEFEAFRKEVRAFEKLMRAEFAGVEEGFRSKRRRASVPPR